MILRAFYIFFCLIRFLIILLFRITLNIGYLSKSTFHNILGELITALLESLGPTYIKMGQLLSTRRDLFPPEILSHLITLQDELTPISYDYLSSEFYKEFGLEIENVFSWISRKPIATASIASVFKARLSNGKEAAIKIRKPGISKIIEEDIRLINGLLKTLPFLQILKHVPLLDIFNEISESVKRQVDFKVEVDSIKRLTKALKKEKLIKLPSIYEAYCSESILTMEYFGELEGAKRKNIKDVKHSITTGLKALYRMIFIEGFVHCDMHPANFFLLEDGKVILIDFGLIAEMETKARLSFAEFFYSMAVNDGFVCAEITLEMATLIPPYFNKDAFYEEIILLVDKYSGLKVTTFEVSGFVVGMFDIQRKYRIHSTSAFIMAIISLLVFEGVAKTVDPGLDFQSISIPYIQEALNMRRRI